MSRKEKLEAKSARAMGRIGRIVLKKMEGILKDLERVDLRPRPIRKPETRREQGKARDAS